MKISESELKEIVDDNLELINSKSRLDRFLLHSTIDKITKDGKKAEKLRNLELMEMNIANNLSEHVKKCGKKEPCEKEKCMSQQLAIIDTKKRQIINAKTLWESTKSNPIGIGILLIGITNIIIALISIFN